MRFKNHKVWLAVDDTDTPVVKNGKWLIKYRLDQSYRYWVRPENVRALDETTAASRPPLDAADPDRRRQDRRRSPLSESRAKAADIQIYTDGAASGNPGPAGIGVVWHQGEEMRELSRYIGDTTNNVAELEAIRTALAAVKDRDLSTVVHTDSGYAYGVLTLGWKAKKNRALIEDIKRLMSGFKDLAFVKVRGHAGDRWNERADELARKAVKSRR
jgi:ribonuclease HI